MNPTAPVRLILAAAVVLAANSVAVAGNASSGGAAQRAFVGWADSLDTGRKRAPAAAFQGPIPNFCAEEAAEDKKPPRRTLAARHRAKEARSLGRAFSSGVRRSLKRPGTQRAKDGDRLHY